MSQQQPTPPPMAVAPAIVTPAPVADRVISIDVLKGVSILLVVLAHVALFNFVWEEKWIYYVIYTFLDCFGPSMFVFLSCLGVVFSIKKKRGGTSDKKSRNAVFQRAIAIFVIGIIPNIITNFKFGVLSFWYWFILQFLAFSQIITFYALKLPKITRMILAFLIIFIITPTLFENITTSMLKDGISYFTLGPGDLSNPNALLYWFLFYPAFMTPPLPWVAVPLIASIVGDALVKASNKGTREAKMNFVRSALVDGIIFVLVSMVFGGKIVQIDYGLNIIYGINQNPYFQIAGLPEFLIMHSNFNLLYNMGISLVFLSLVFYLTEVRRIRGRVSNLFNFYGRFSLSLFVYHVGFGMFFPNMLTVPWLAVYVIAVYAALYYFLKLLVVKFEGIGTLEWVTSKFNRAKNASKIFFESQIRGFKEGFQKITKKVRKLFVSDDTIDNPLEIFMYEALGEDNVDAKKRKKEKAKQTKAKPSQQQSTEKEPS